VPARAGDVEAVSPAIGDVHRVRNALSDATSVSIHVYGANIGAVRRSVYTEAGERKPFVSGYSGAWLPNLWDRSARPDARRRRAARANGRPRPPPGADAPTVLVHARASAASAPRHAHASMISFDAPAGPLLAALVNQPDTVPFGAISIDREHRAVSYNAVESRAAGLSPERVLGKPFFTEVAPCMNNFMVSQRFADADAIDETIDFVLTLRMRPTRVRMRLLREAGAASGWVLIERAVR
jgi:photoactive yellow protein